MHLSPLSKSTWATFELCPWKAHAHKNLGLESVAGPAAEAGKEAHTLIENVLRGHMTPEEAIAKASDPEIGDWIQAGLDHVADIRREYGDINLLVEEYTCADKNGKRVETPAEAMIHGYKDLLINLHEQKTTLIVDWKSGRWEKDNELERHEYALLGRAAYPKNDTVIFRLVFLRTGHILETRYEWSDKGKTCTITHDDKAPKTVSGKIDPILEYFHVRIQRIKRTAPKPKPGKHCEKWYGKPCQFLGCECPLSADLPTVLDELSPQESAIVANSFRSVLKAEQTELTKEAVSLATYATWAIKKHVKTVETSIQEWARQHGPFEIGDTAYGWFQKDEYTVDVPFALSALFEALLPMEEIAKVVNVSKTSLGKLSKRQYPALRQTIEDWAITSQKGKMKFGAIDTGKSAITEEGGGQTE